MAQNFKRTYKFAASTAAYITLFMTAGMFVIFYLTQTTSYWYLIIVAMICYAFTFFVIQNRAQRLIYKRIKQIYDEVSILDASSLGRSQITTDMATLTEQVGKFAENKKLEIESLKIRENYRKEFLGNVSHELKTPLFTVQGYILTLLDGAMKDKAVRKKYLKRASKGVDRLIYIVKDLDMISKLEVGGLSLTKEPFKVGKLVRNVFDQLEMKAEKKDIKLLVTLTDQDVVVMADKERIQQVLTNLVDNSIKYGQKGGTTEVSIENLLENKTIIRVTDNGEGIEKEDLQRIFERFYRVDKTGNRKVGGSGLGLSIVKHIIDAHGEKIYVESNHGVGSEFSFTLENNKATP